MSGEKRRTRQARLPFPLLFLFVFAWLVLLRLSFQECDAAPRAKIQPRRERERDIGILFCSVPVKSKPRWGKKRKRGGLIDDRLPLMPTEINSCGKLAARGDWEIMPARLHSSRQHIIHKTRFEPRPLPPKFISVPHGLLGAPRGDLPPFPLSPFFPPIQSSKVTE